MQISIVDLDSLILLRCLFQLDIFATEILDTERCAGNDGV